MRKLFLLLVSHGAVLSIGFALGIYFLPILTAPKTPDAAVLEQQAENALFTAELTRDLRGSDFLHWGEGKISITSNQIVHEGALAPGPDYKLYLVNEFVEHEDEFLPLKDQAKLIGDIKTFDGFLLDLLQDVDLTQFTTVLIWCETFGEFISSAKYR